MDRKVLLSRNDFGFLNKSVPRVQFGSSYSGLKKFEFGTAHFVGGQLASASPEL